MSEVISKHDRFSLVLSYEIAGVLLAMIISRLNMMEPFGNERKGKEWRHLVDSFWASGVMLLCAVNLYMFLLCCCCYSGCCCLSFSC